MPDGGCVENGEALAQSLGDDAELDVAVVGGEFTVDLIPIGFSFAVKILIAGTEGPASGAWWVKG